jgi:hypothetical protein
VGLVEQRNWLRFAKKNIAAPLLALRLCPLPKAHAWSTTVLVDELDACGLHVALHRLEETAAAVLKLYSDRPRHRPLE